MSSACECPPCPGRGNDGHGMTHCAECCFGTGVEADITCPYHGDPYDQPVQIQGHMHSEPACAWPDCQTYLTRDDMRILHLRTPPGATS